MHRFKNIGVIIDLKGSNEEVLSHAKELVVTNQATVHLLCVLSENLTTKQQAAVEKSIQEKVDFNFSLHYIIGKAVVEITRYSEAQNLDMIIIQAEHETNAINRFFQGSLVLSLMRKTPCPIWLVKKVVPNTYQRILIAVDPEAENDGATLNDKLIQIGTSYAKRQSAECYLVTAWLLEGESTLTGPFIKTPPEEIKRLKTEKKIEFARKFEALQKRHHNLLKGCETQMLYGTPGYAIAKFVEENKIDLIVMGTLARTGVQGFLIGNTAETIINQVNCSIIAIKPDGFLSPILA